MARKNIIFKNRVGGTETTIETTFEETGLVHEFSKFAMPTSGGATEPHIVLIDLKNITQTITVKGYIYYETGKTATVKRTEMISLMNVGGTCTTNWDDYAGNWIVQTLRIRDDSTNEYPAGEPNKYFVEITVMKMHKIMRGN